MRLTERYIREVQQRLQLAAEVTLSADVVEDYCADWLEQDAKIKEQAAEIISWTGLVERRRELDERQNAELAALRKVAEVAHQCSSDPFCYCGKLRQALSEYDALKGGKE